ncbi:uncharacterized protein DUF4148 [Trinickia symbiotica]|nr:DUF4148 domain-containing protein [Trinickia symbiotica]PPK47104.1 uncharacterized protein DUF4148 [Trinickia symbiotica]
MKASIHLSSHAVPVLRAMISLLAVGAFAVPVAAQQQTTVTRAQVRAEVAELIGAGYNPSDRNHYPDNLQVAQRRVQAQRGESGQSVTEGAPVADISGAAMTNEAVGGARSGTSMSGGPQSDVISSTCHGFPVCTSGFIGR